MSTIARSEAAQIAALCNDCGVPHMTAALLTEGVSLDVAKTRVSAVGAARDITMLARRQLPSIAADFGERMLAEGKSIADIRSAAFASIVAEEEKTSISSHVPIADAHPGATASQASMQRELKAAGIQPRERNR